MEKSFFLIIYERPPNFKNSIKPQHYIYLMKL